MTVALRAGHVVTIGCFVAVNGCEQAKPITECVMPPVTTFDTGSVQVVGAGLSSVCELAINSGGIRLIARAGQPDPSGVLIQTNHGTFLTFNAPGSGPTIAEWDSAGQFLRVVGRSGSGPGEFVDNGGINVFVDDGDSIHVRDGGGNWTVLDPARRFVRRLPSVHLGGQRNSTVLVNGARIVTTFYAAGDRNSYIHVRSSNGTIVGDFGPVGPADQSRARSRARPLATDGKTIWVGPIDGDGYRLENWTPEGRLLRTLVREVSWLPPGASTSTVDRRPPPRITALHIDSNGLLIVRSSAPNAYWRFGMTPAERLNIENYPFDNRLEVIDTRSATLLVSQMNQPGQSGVAFVSGRPLVAIRNDEDPSTVRVVGYGIRPRPLTGRH